jgi:hypothetical protein
MLLSRGFGSKFRGWVSKVLINGSFCVRINDQNSQYFVAGKGLKQGDPLSLILFNCIAEVFTKMLHKAAQRNLIRGLLPNVVPGGVISLQYADDTILFLEPDSHMARLLKWILTCFECLSGLKINYHKSDLMTLNLPEGAANEFAQFFCCNLGAFPFRYLGVPLHFAKLRREDLQPIVDLIIKKISGLRGKLISYEGKLILIRACLASIPTYLLSVIKFPKWAINAIYSQMANFFGGDMDDQHKYHLADWGLITRKKEFGGLGVPNLRDMNLCLLGSWFKRFFSTEDKIFRKIIEYKYNTSPNILWINPIASSSPFWKG